MTHHRLSDADFDAIVAAGIRAPSADNRHLLQLELVGTSIRFWASDEYFAAPFHRQALCFVGFGAVIENMLIYARSLGWEGNSRCNTTVAPDAPLAQIDFVAATPEVSALASAIPDRHTNRSFFHGPGLTHEALRTIEAEISAVPNVSVHWFHGLRSRNKVARLAAKAEAARFLTGALHEELFASIRFDVGWQQSADEGLPPGALAIEGPLRAAFASLRHVPLMRALSAVGVHRLIGLRAGYAPCLSAPTLAVLAFSHHDVREGSWAVGRALERLWLRATLLGYAVQPLAAPALYALEGATAVPPKLQRHLSIEWAKLVPDASPLIAVRLGKADGAAVRTGRRPTSSYIRHA